MGITSLDDKKDNVLSLAIGGMTDGVSPLEMAAAYGTIANDGIYITPTFYTKVVDSSGNTVLTPKQEQVRAVSEQTAYLTKKITQEPVNSSRGTATYCKISGMDVAAKQEQLTRVMTDGYVDLRHIILPQHGLDMMTVKK